MYLYSLAFFSRIINTNLDCIIQVLPPLNIKRICQIQKLPDIEIISARSSNIDSDNISKNNQYLQIIFKEKDEIRPSICNKEIADNILHENITPENTSISNGYLKQIENVTNNFSAAPSDIEFSKYPKELHAESSSTQIDYNSSFEQLSSQHPSSYSMTDDDKASAAESLKADSHEYIVNNKHVLVKQAHHDKPKIIFDDQEKVQEKGLELPGELMQIIDDIFDSSSENSVVLEPESKSPMPNIVTPQACKLNNERVNSRLHNLKIVNVVHENISPKIDFKDMSMQTVDFSTGNVMNAFVQTDSLMDSVDKYHVQDANADSILSTQKIFDHIRNEKVAFFHRHSEMRPSQLIRQPNNITEENDRQYNLQFNQSFNRQSPHNPIQLPEVHAENSLLHKYLEIKNIPSNSTSYPKNNSSSSNERNENLILQPQINCYRSSETQQNQYYENCEIRQTTPRFHSQYNTNKQLSPSERFRNFKRNQELLRKHPNMLKTIQSIQNESINYSGPKSSLNASYRSYYEDDSIQKAAEKFLNSIQKSNDLNNFKCKGTSSSSNFSPDCCRLLFQTDSSMVFDALQPTTTTTPSNSTYFSPKWNDVNSKYFCTNSEESKSSNRGKSFKKSQQIKDFKVGENNITDCNSNLTSKFEFQFQTQNDEPMHLTNPNSSKDSNDVSTKPHQITTTNTSNENTRCQPEISTSSSIENQMAKLENELQAFEFEGVITPSEHNSERISGSLSENIVE